MELHVMAQRLQANKRAAAERGELRTPLPVGYVHDDAGDIVIDPDAEVQAAIRDVFAAFAACGSAYGVVTAFEERRFPLRAYGGAWAGQLRWGRLTHARVLGVLKNPCYAEPTCAAATRPAAPSSRAGPCAPGCWNGPGPSGRC
jgi:DNA invertase Pin-like site-specific DNA recombinase